MTATRERNGDRDGRLYELSGSFEELAGLRLRARTLAWRGRLEEAEAFFLRAHRIDPLDVEVSVGFARVLARRGDPKAGLELLRALSDVRPHEFELRLAQGQLLAQLGRGDEALPELERALDLDPTEARARSVYARVLRTEDRLDQARAFEAESVELFTARLVHHPNEPETQVARAAALANLGDTDAALADYNRVLSYAPRSLDAGLGAARCELRLGRVDAACSRVRRIVAGEPESAEALSLLGDVHRRSGRNEQAIAAYVDALALDARLVEAHLGLARARRATGDAEGAVSAGTIAGQIDPYDRDVRDLLAALAETPDERRFRLDLAFRRDELSGGRSSWSQESAQLGWRARRDLEVALGVDFYRRFDEDEVVLSGECTWSVDEDWTLAARYAHGLEAELVAREVFEVEIARKLSQQHAGYLRWRRSCFADGVEGELLSPGLEIACGERVRLLARYFLVDDSEAGIGHAGSLRAAFWPEEELSPRIGIAYGRESFLASTQDEIVRAADVLTLSAGLDWRCAELALVRLDYEFEDHDDAYERHGLALGFRWEF